MSQRRQNKEVTYALMKRRFNLDCSNMTLKRHVMKPLGMRYGLRARKPAVLAGAGRRDTVQSVSTLWCLFVGSIFNFGYPTLHGSAPVLGVQKFVRMLDWYAVGCLRFHSFPPCHGLPPAVLRRDAGAPRSLREEDDQGRRQHEDDQEDPRLRRQLRRQDPDSEQGPAAAERESTRTVIFVP